MNESTNKVVTELWGAIKGISGLGQVSHDQYKSIYLRIFKDVQKDDINLGGDAISNIISTRFGDQIKDEHKKALESLVTSWREWKFFLKNYEPV